MQQLQPVAAARGRKVIVHPGVVKTATSTLQRHVFPKLEAIRFLGLPAPDAELDWAVKHLCQADSVHLEAERLQQAFEAGIAVVPADRTLLISYENYALYKSKDKGLVAERVKTLFPEAQIIFTLRAQEGLIVSRYFNDLRKRIKLKSFISFEDWYWFERRESYRTIFDDLRYFPVLDYYARLFGRDRVEVVLFEELKASPRGFAEHFARALGADAEEFEALMAGKRENSAMSRRYYAFWRHLGPLLPRRIVRDLATRFPSRAGPPARIALPAEIRSDLIRLCADDNRRLAEAFDLDLAGYGYWTDVSAAGKES